jgi:hypothetical protein
MLKIKIITKDLNEQEIEKIELARLHIEKTVNSYEFYNFVIKYSFSVNKCTGKLWWKKCSPVLYNNFWSTNLTNKEVYETIMKGSEKLSKEGENESADIFLQIDKSYSRNVIGYTSPDIQWQFIYNWFFKQSSTKEIAGNLFHEWLHKIGFDHDFRNNSFRPHSVPYALGEFVAISDLHQDI